MEDYAWELTPVAGPALRAQGKIEQWEFVEDEVEAEQIVNPVPFVGVDSLFAFAVLEQPFVVLDVKFDIANDQSGYFLESY